MTYQLADIKVGKTYLVKTGKWSFHLLVSDVPGDRRTPNLLMTDRECMGKVVGPDEAMEKLAGEGIFFTPACVVRELS